jgi:hypothetical protein
MVPNTGFCFLSTKSTNSTTASAWYSTGTSSLSVASVSRASSKRGTSTFNISRSKLAANAGLSRTNAITPSCITDGDGMEIHATLLNALTIESRTARFTRELRARFATEASINA